MELVGLWEGAVEFAWLLTPAESSLGCVGFRRALVNRPAASYFFFPIPVSCWLTVRRAAVMKTRTLRLCQSEGGTFLIMPSNPHCKTPASLADVGGSSGGGGCCCMLLSHSRLTQVGDWYSSGRAPGQCVIHINLNSPSPSPHNLFLFKLHFFFFFGRQHGLALNAAALIPSYRKNSLFPSFLSEHEFQWKGEQRIFCIVFFFFCLQAAHDCKGFSPIFVYNTELLTFCSLPIFQLCLLW